MIFCPLPLIDGSPLFQAELERNIAAIIQQDLEHVSLVGDVYRSILSTDVKDPLLARGIPTEGCIGRGGGRPFGTATLLQTVLEKDR